MPYFNNVSSTAAFCIHVQERIVSQWFTIVFSQREDTQKKQIPPQKKVEIKAGG